VRFASGRRERAELVVFADGIGSPSRRRISPSTDLENAGYGRWRGTVPESQLAAYTFDLLHDAITYSFAPHTHMVVYPIWSPDGGLAVGERLLNYVWYRNVAEGHELDELMTDKRGFLAKVSLHPGAVQDRYVHEIRSAAKQLLAPAVAEVVLRTEQPYLQAVYDSCVTRMALGTAKAAANAWALYDALRETPDIAEALAKWEPAQLQLGERLLRRVKDMGTRSQVSCSWDPADPELRFGLYGPTP
jgi:2,6-dihydroxypyridine 3-monooxygenase